jgi:hypothetical protein
LTKFPSLILLFLLLIAYILVSYFIVRDNIQSYSFADDFLDDYIIYQNKVTTVKEILNEFCTLSTSQKDSMRLEIEPVLKEHFEMKYHGSYFAFVHKFGLERRVYFSNIDESYDIDSEGDLSLITENGNKKFDYLFDSKFDSVEVRNSAKIAQGCSLDDFLYIKEVE